MTGRGKRVLVVEHDEGERNVLGLMLRGEGYHVHTASEEGPALEELKRRRFDVVVAAHHMPHVNGFRLALLGRLVWPDTPMILLLENDPSVPEAPDQRGAYGSLQKPYIFGKLLGLMESAIRFAHRRQAQTSKPTLLSS